MTSYTERSEAMMQLSRGLRKLGFASLLFFTVKGLLWIAIPALIAQQFS